MYEEMFSAYICVGGSGERLGIVGGEPFRQIGLDGMRARLIGNALGHSWNHFSLFGAPVARFSAVYV